MVKFILTTPQGTGQPRKEEVVELNFPIKFGDDLKVGDVLKPQKGDRSYTVTERRWVELCGAWVLTYVVR